MDRWLDFLTRQGAIWQNGELTSFADEPPAPSARLVPLLEHRLLTVEGPDAAKFLQGQLTCDVRRLEQNQILLGAHCNPKGRMISSFVIAASGPERITLRVRSSIAAQAKAALQKYIVFSKAKIKEEASIPVAVLGLGSDLSALSELPQAGCSATAEPGRKVLHHNSQYVELWLSEEQAEVVWPQLAQSCSPSGTAWFNLHQVRAGLAEVQATTQEEFIPQMFNYHLVDAISFKKGCYTGQEIVARMQYRGQTKKHTYHAAVAGQVEVPVGTKLVSLGDSNANLGTVVASGRTHDASEILVVTTADVASASEVAAGLESPAKLEWLPLPYAIP